MIQRVTTATVTVAAALLVDPAARQWGYDLRRQTGVRSGVLYPILQRMLDAGWLADGWEDPTEEHKGRPPRRYYTITDVGLLELQILASPTAG